MNNTNIAIAIVGIYKFRHSFTAFHSNPDRITRVSFHKSIAFPPQSQGLLDNRVFSQSKGKYKLVEIVKNLRILKACYIKTH